MTGLGSSAAFASRPPLPLYANPLAHSRQPPLSETAAPSRTCRRRGAAAMAPAPSDFKVTLQATPDGNLRRIKSKRGPLLPWRARVSPVDLNARVVACT
jgi:hypothetical protein